MATIDDFKKIEIRVGRIVSVVRVPDSLKLVKLQVSFGEFGERTIVAGIATSFPDESVLVGRRCAFVFNLEPRALMGIESQGMILVAGEGDTLSLLSVDGKVPEGSVIR